MKDLLKYELALWFLLPMALLVFFSFQYGVAAIFINKSIPLELILAFSPFLFSILFYFIYQSFPLNYALKLYYDKKNV